MSWRIKIISLIESNEYFFSKRAVNVSFLTLLSLNVEFQKCWIQFNNAQQCCDMSRWNVAIVWPGFAANEALQLDVKTVILTRAPKAFIVVSVSCILRLSYVLAPLTWGVSCSQGSCKHLFAGRSSLGQSQFPDACFHVPALGVSWLFPLPLLLGVQGKLVLPSWLWLATIRQLGSSPGVAIANGVGQRIREGFVHMCWRRSLINTWDRFDDAIEVPDLVL